MIKDNRDVIIRKLREKIKDMQVITEQELVEISSEAVSVVEAAFGIGIEYDEIVLIIQGLLIEKLELWVDTSTETLDKSNDWWYNTTLNKGNA